MDRALGKPLQCEEPGSGACSSTSDILASLLGSHTVAILYLLQVEGVPLELGAA